MRATRETLEQFFERAFESMNLMARNIEVLNTIKAELNNLEADAELGRAVRKAFEKGYGMVDEEMFGFDSAEELIEWGRDCERY
jgi:secreted Zn-dependent insulinase-like peptidase